MGRMGKAIAGYGALLALGTGLLQWLDYQRLARSQPGEVYLFLLAAGFLVLGVVLGARLFGAAPRPFDGNPAARDQLGISPREQAILQHVADGLTNKEIARRLEVSPNTVKTHVANLFGKLGAARRTDAVAKARALGLLP